MPILLVDQREPDLAVREATAWLRAGSLIVFPTDTFYALGADPFNAAAVARLFEVKGRADTVAVPLIAATPEAAAAAVGGWNPSTARLVGRCWPGPLSIVVSAPPSIACALHAGLGTVAVRVPACSLARELARAIGGLITATSANRSGAPPVTVVAELDEVGRDTRVLVLDDGPTPGGPPSTIVDARAEPPMLVREGAIPWARVVEAIGATNSR